MPISNISHPYRLDSDTILRVNGSPGASSIPAIARFPNSVRLMSFSPVIFTHAYQLLGQHPQRFGQDLSLYLASVRAFFERADVSGGVDLTNFGNADSKRRLSEDLGVAYASLFMVQVFGLQWRTIAQIPHNGALTRTRPDFEGFGAQDERFLYEAKGTTQLTKIESCMSKAIGQVKHYPEQADSKFAIVTYLCADRRFFPTASFVVDPPAMPSAVPPDIETSRLLHLIKALEFGGFLESAKAYTKALSVKLIEVQAARERAEDWVTSRRLGTLLTELAAIIEDETQRDESGQLVFEDVQYVGRNISLKDAGMDVFTGIAQALLGNARRLVSELPLIQTKVFEQNDTFTSVFDDGTLLRITLHNAPNNPHQIVLPHHK